jgi:hypothetical protein
LDVSGSRPPYIGGGLVTVLVSGCPAVGSSVAIVLTWARHPLSLCLGTCYFIKCLLPLDQHLRGIRLLLCLGSFRGGEACSLVGGGQVWLASCWSPASVDLVRATLLLAKCSLEEFHRLHRLDPSMMKSPASCWHSRPFG